MNCKERDGCAHADRATPKGSWGNIFAKRLKNTVDELSEVADPTGDAEWYPFLTAGGKNDPPANLYCQKKGQRKD